MKNIFGGANTPSVRPTNLESYSAKAKSGRLPYSGRKLHTHEIPPPPPYPHWDDLHFIYKQQIEMGRDFKGWIKLQLCSAVTDVTDGAVNQTPTTTFVNDASICDYGAPPSTSILAMHFRFDDC
jgi:hypothetical protein